MTFVDVMGIEEYSKDNPKRVKSGRLVLNKFQNIIKVNRVRGTRTLFVISDSQCLLTKPLYE